jgi:hypothetical protein
MKEETNSQLVFVVGRGRSGTSLLCSILSSHPDVAVVPEGLFIINLYKKYRGVNHWDEKSLMRFYHDLLLDERLSQWWNFDKAEMKEELKQLEGERTFSSLCRFVYQKEACATGRKEPGLIIDKNNTYSLFIPEIVEVFPTAKFVHIVRDPRDTVASYKQVSFDASGTIALAQRWKHYNRVILNDAARFPDKFHLILFEDLLLKPQKTLSDLCSFLGIDFSDDLLQFYKNNRYYENLKGSTEAVRTAYQNIQNPLDPQQAFKWKKKSADDERQKINAICHEEMEYFGYERGDYRPSVLSSLRAFPGILYGKLLNFLERFVFDLPLWLRVGIIHLYRKKTKTI